MAEIMVVKAFTLTRDDGTVEHFAPGRYDVEDDIAKHWYAKAHTQEGDQVEDRRRNNQLRSRVGTPAHEQAQAQLAHGDMIDQSQMDAEIAAATAEVRKKYEEQGQSRRRAQLNPDVIRELDADDTDEEHGEDGEEGDAEGRKSRGRRRRAQPANEGEVPATERSMGDVASAPGTSDQGQGDR